MRYLATKAGTAHVITKDTSCPIVKRNVDAWKGQRSLKPSVVLSEYKDCAKCETFENARAELRQLKENAATADYNRREVNRFNRSSGPQPKKPTKKLTGPDYRKNRPNTGGGSKRLKVGRDITPQVRSGDNWPVADERTTLKAKEHANIAGEHGWSVQVTANERRGLTVIASKGDEICVLAYRENGILWNDEIRFKVPGRSVPMHNSGTWRRQVSLPEGQRPISARPKRFGRKPKLNGIERSESANSEPTEDEIDGDVIPLNVASLPFSKDDDDLIIVDAIKGMELFWRNNMMQKVVSARVPSKARMIRFGVTGREPNQRRCVSFPESEMSKDGEIYGAERTVAIESMLRVRP